MQGGAKLNCHLLNPSLQHTAVLKDKILLLLRYNIGTKALKNVTIVHTHTIILHKGQGL